jgi:hypothetical protein
MTHPPGYKRSFAALRMTVGGQSPTNVESAEMFGWLSPFDPYIAHLGGRRSSSQQSKQLFERGTSSLGQYFYVSAGVVAHVSTKAKSDGFLDDKVAEAHTLYHSTHPGV